MIIRHSVKLPLNFDILSQVERQLFFDELWCDVNSPAPILDVEPPEHNAQLLRIRVSLVESSASHMEVSFELTFSKFRACHDQQCDWTLTRSVRGTRSGFDVLFESYRATEGG